MDMGGAMIAVVVVMMVVMMGGMAWAGVAALRAHIRGERDKPD